MNIILLGPPGSGKGTQSNNLVEKYKLSHISTGDILRSQIAEKTKLGNAAKVYMDKGDLVPDNLIIDMVSNTTKTLYFEVPFEKLIDRLSQRISCKNCSKTFSKSDKEYLCQEDCSNQELYQREDDKPEAISKRMETYKDLTEPLLEFYQSNRLLRKINADSSIPKVTEEIDKILQ